MVKSLQYSAAADGNHDFEAVSRGQDSFLKAASGNDFTIPFHGNAALCQVKLRNHLGHCGGSFEAAILTVNGELYHGYRISLTPSFYHEHPASH